MLVTVLLIVLIASNAEILKYQLFNRDTIKIFWICSTGYIDVGDFILMTIFGCKWQNFDIGDIFWILVPDANAKR